MMRVDGKRQIDNCLVASLCSLHFGQYLGKLENLQIYQCQTHIHVDKDTHAHTHNLSIAMVVLF